MTCPSVGYRRRPYEDFVPSLRSALNRAMKLELVERNVATLVDLAKPVRIEIRVLSPEEVRRFLDEADSDRFAALWYVLVTTGLRPGEALGLKWEDWDGNKLRVRRALVRVPGQGWSLKETKTRRSRVVALPEMTIRALEEHRTRQKRERLQVSSTYVDRGLIFARSTGEPVESNNLKKRYFKPILEAAGLPDMRLYDLRHTAATLRLVNGEHPKVGTRDARACVDHADHGHVFARPPGDAGGVGGEAGCVVGGKVTGASPQLQGLPLAAGLAAPLEGGHLDLSPKNDGTVGSP